MRTRRIKNVSRTACQAWCTPAHKCGSPYCCPEAYIVPTQPKQSKHKGAKR
jgi:hypothetical protein